MALKQLLISSLLWNAELICLLIQIPGAKIVFGSARSIVTGCLFGNRITST